MAKDKIKKDFVAMTIQIRKISVRYILKYQLFSPDEFQIFNPISGPIV